MVALPRLCTGGAAFAMLAARSASAGRSGCSNIKTVAASSSCRLIGPRYRCREACIACEPIELHAICLPCLQLLQLRSGCDFEICCVLQWRDCSCRLSHQRRSQRHRISKHLFRRRGGISPQAGKPSGPTTRVFPCWRAREFTKDIFVDRHTVRWPRAAAFIVIPQRDWVKRIRRR